MAELELLADDDVASGLRERPRGREAHHARADDDDLGVEGGHAPQRNRLRQQVEQLARAQLPRRAVLEQLDLESARLLVHRERQLGGAAGEGVERLCSGVELGK
jgi:hypothetical protein